MEPRHIPGHALLLAAGGSGVPPGLLRVAFVYPVTVGASHPLPLGPQHRSAISSLGSLLPGAVGAVRSGRLKERSVRPRSWIPIQLAHYREFEERWAWDQRESCLQGSWLSSMRRDSLKG